MYFLYDDFHRFDFLFLGGKKWPESEWGSPSGDLCADTSHRKDGCFVVNITRLRVSSSLTRDPLIKTHWGRVTHIYVIRLTITGSDNDLSPGRRQTIIWTDAGILLIGPLGTNFSENSIEILTFSFTKMRLKVSSAKWRPFCFGLNVLTWISNHMTQYSVGWKLLIHFQTSTAAPLKFGNG